MSLDIERYLPQDGPKSDGRGTIIRARADKKAAGHNLSFCPFGCAMDSDDLTPQGGYCRHLAGFTLASEGKPKVGSIFHPWKRRPQANLGNGSKGADDYWHVDGNDPQEVTEEDWKWLVQGSVSWRVYRNVDKKAEPVREPVIVSDPFADVTTDTKAPVVATKPKKTRAKRANKAKTPATPVTTGA